MSRSIQPTDYSQPAPPAPVEYQVEKCGGLLVYIPIKPSKP